MKSGFTQFYYQNGIVSSEGIMKNGKPTGVWKSYYNTGKLKSIGKRTSFLLDSTWIFYTEDGLISDEIDYRLGKKNGYHKKYTAIETKGKIINQIISKELYLNDLKQHNSFYYKDNILSEIVKYKDGVRHGISKELNKDSLIISIIQYRNGFIVSKEFVNRFNSINEKNGLWKELWDNDKTKKEAEYKNGVLHGYYKEYSKNGKLLINHRYKNGVLVEDVAAKPDKIITKKEYYQNGKLRSIGGFRQDTSIGLHKLYDTSGVLLFSSLYDDKGVLLGKGKVDEKNRKESMWEFFYPDGKIKSKGLYKQNRKIGNWQFYFQNGKVEQKGKFKNGRFDGKWIWYYENGQIAREEEYLNGKENGYFIEYNNSGETVAKGEYVEGVKEGLWFQYVGDSFEEGNYVNGQKNGTWTHHFPNGTMSFSGDFIHGTEQGKHRTYHENGELKSEGEYQLGIRKKRWKFYNPDGSIKTTITYKNGKEYKYNGVKVEN